MAINISNFVQVTESLTSPTIAPQSFVDRFRETIRTYIVGTGWSFIDFLQILNTDYSILIRVTFRAPGDSEDLELGFTYDWPSMAYTARIHEEIGRREIRDAIQHIEQEMAQWNQRQHERLQEQARQREAESARRRRLVTDSASLQESVGFRISEPATVVASTPYTTYTGNTFFPDDIPNTTWIPTNVGAYQGIPPTSQDEHLKDSYIKDLVKEALKENLELRFSLDESDGEVSLDIEVLFDGEVIASDSDTVRVNSYNYE